MIVLSLLPVFQKTLVKFAIRRAWGMMTLIWASGGQSSVILC